MSVNMSVVARNAELDAAKTAIGIGAVLKIISGAKPANITDADGGVVLATITLPSDWMNAASNGSKTMLGTWQTLNADAAGTAGHFRLFASDGATQHIQGTLTATGLGGDITIDNVVIAAGQTVTVTAFTLTAGNA
jgi:hypothetical protein